MKKELPHTLCIASATYEAAPFLVVSCKLLLCKGMIRKGDYTVPASSCPATILGMPRRSAAISVKEEK